jgi:ankyrin repeat protein
MTKVANATDAQYQTLCVKLKQMSAIMIAPRGIPPKSAEDMENAEPKRTNSPAPDGRELILNSGNKNEETKKLTKLALALETQGHFILASGVYGRMIEILGKRHQPDDPVMLFCSDKLASMFRDKGEYDKAEDLSLTILKARMKASGRGDIATLSTLGNLALTMRHQGRSQEAYEMLRDALEFTSTSMFQSMAHITTVSILAKLLKDCRFYDFSAFLSRDVLMASMNFLGFDDPFTLNRLSDLAVVLSKQGKYRLSEEISSRALNGLGKCLGTDHPHTLRTAKRLANYMRFQGKYDEACVRLDRTLKSQKKQLGTAHPDTLSTICGLAATYVLQGRVREGELHLRHAEREQLRVLGDQHLDTRWTAHALSLIDDFHQPFGEDVDREAAKQGMLDFLRKPSGTIPISSSKDSTKSSAPSSMTAIEAPNNPHPENIDIALRVAAMKGDEIAVQAALSRGARIDSTGGFCGTALQAASLAGHENIVNTLLKAAAQVNAQGGLFGTALCAASFGGHTVIVRRLLAAGADPNAKEGTRSSSLKAAVAMRHQDIIQALLGAHESLNSISDGTALHDASMTGQEDTVHALLEKGADPNIPTGFFGGALQAAAWAGQANIVQLLLDRGALQAAWVGQVNIAQLPRDRGAPFESHFEGHTALYLAATGGYENVMRILTQRPDVATRHSASGFADAFPAPSAAIASDTVAAAVAVGGGGKREERAGERVASAGRHSADLLGNGEGEEGQGRVPIGVKQKLKYFRRYILRKLAN